MYADTLTLAEDMREAMQAKFDEYERRERDWKDMSKWESVNNALKKEILLRLLVVGRFEAEEMRVRVQASGGGFDEKFDLAFRNSVGVINNYLTGNGRNDGGTGLPTPAVPSQ